MENETHLTRLRNQAYSMVREVLPGASNTRCDKVLNDFFNHHYLKKEEETRPAWIFRCYQILHRDRSLFLEFAEDRTRMREEVFKPILSQIEQHVFSMDLRQIYTLIKVLSLEKNRKKAMLEQVHNRT